MFQDYLLAFIPIFVAVDPIGLLPVFVGLTSDITRERKRKIILQSMVTALALSIGFIFLGKAIFYLLGITVADFMIAGGLILLCIAILDLVKLDKVNALPVDELGAVPIGTPLIVGPAVLATSIIVIDQYGLYPTIFAVLTNVVLVGLMFLGSDVLINSLGKAGSRALSKLTSLLLAAIAVMLVRKGMFYILMPG
jgi:multiple antibiotic resistance protein